MTLTDGLHAFIWQSMSANNCNTYLIDGPRRVLIDPGHRAMFAHVEQGLDRLGLTPADIDVAVCTHGHPDHLEAVPLLRGHKAKFTLHQDEWRWIEDVGRQMSAAFGIDLDGFQPDFFLREGELRIGDLSLEVIHAPGHSPGSICLYWPASRALFTGDVIFREGLGRTDLPGGDGQQLKDSILRLAALDVEFLLPGHGAPVEGTDAVRRNFERVKSFYFDYI